MKVCTLCIQETISKKLYILYTRNLNHIWKVLYTHTKGKQKFIMVLAISTGKKQIMLISNVSMTNNKSLEQLKRFYSGKN